MDLLAMLKALGDESRFSMYRELAGSTGGCSAKELADSLGLHANTVRLHLDRLREAGLVDVEAVHRGTVGRPTHIYSLAPGAPGLGFDAPSYTLLSGLLAALAERVGADGDDAVQIGLAGGVEAGRRTAARSVGSLVEAEDKPGCSVWVAVGAGGGYGLSFEMFFDGERGPDDIEQVSGEGVRVVVAPASAEYLSGASLDYKDGLQDAG